MDDAGKMTREEIIDGLEIYTVGRLNEDEVYITVGELQEFINEIKALEQEPCEDAISRQAVLDKMKERDEDLSSICPRDIRELPPVTPQPKMGCEGCIYEKTGNNSTYPCSHCGRCYTDKYKAESEE